MEVCQKFVNFAKIIGMELQMPDDLLTISQKIEILARQRDEARQAAKRALEEVADLKAEVAKVKEELHHKMLDIEFLTLSHKLADTPQALAEARATIRRMIAGVDRTINLLKEDAAI